MTSECMTLFKFLSGFIFFTPVCSFFSSSYIEEIYFWNKGKSNLTGLKDFMKQQNFEAQHLQKPME